MGLTSDQVLAVLKAVGEDTRLRIVALLAHGELTVSDLVDVLGQSQPRISRHLRLLVEAGVGMTVGAVMIALYVYFSS